jgi:hypothetical protein
MAHVLRSIASAGASCGPEALELGMVVIFQRRKLDVT